MSVGLEPARSRRYHVQTLRPIDDGDISVRRHPACNVEETAGPSDQHQFRQFRAVAAGPGNRAGDRRKNPADAQVVWATQERRRFAGDSRHRPEAAGKNAQISGRRKVARRSPQDASGQFRCAHEMSWMYEGCTVVQVRDATGAIESPTEKARGGRGPNCKGRRRATVSALVAWVAATERPTLCKVRKDGPPRMISRRDGNPR
jgi:hypothetical protein